MKYTCQKLAPWQFLILVVKQGVFRCFPSSDENSDKYINNGILKQGSHFRVAEIAGKCALQAMMSIGTWIYSFSTQKTHRSIQCSILHELAMPGQAMIYNHKQEHGQDNNGFVTTIQEFLLSRFFFLILKGTKIQETLKENHVAGKSVICKFFNVLEQEDHHEGQDEK